MIGIVQVQVDTPYSSLMRQYAPLDFDLIGIYYEQESKINTVLFDVYSGRRLPGDITIGNIFYWSSMVAVESERYEVREETEELVVTSLLLTTIEAEDSLSQVLSTGRSRILDCFYSYDLSGRYYESSRYERQETSAMKINSLDLFYDELHTLLFDLLRRRNLAGLRPFSITTQASVRETKLQKKLQSAAQAKIPVVSLSRDDCNLGTVNFQRTFCIHYEVQEASFTFVANGLSLRLINHHCDLKLLDTKVLHDLFHYMETLPHESYPLLRKSLLEELVTRDQK